MGFKAGKTEALIAAYPPDFDPYPRVIFNIYLKVSKG